MRFKHGIDLWEFQGDSQKFAISKRTFRSPDFRTIQWLNNEEYLALTDFGDVLWRFNVTDNNIKAYYLPRELQIHAIRTVSVNHCDRVIFIASRPLGQPSETLEGIDCIVG